MTVIEFPDVEALLVAYLTTALATTPDPPLVSTQRHTDSPTRLVRLTRTGGVRLNIVEDGPQVTFECWDATDAGAADLAALVRSEVQAMRFAVVNGQCVSWSAEVGGPAYFPHPDTSTPRYQHTQLMTVIGYEVRQGVST